MRNKKEYNSVPDDRKIKCKHCCIFFEKKHFSIRGLDVNGYTGVCRYCDWLRHHEGEKFPKVDGWSDDEIKIVVNFIIMNNSTYLNDLIPLLPNKNLNDLCNLAKQIKIGNYIIDVKANCSCCGKEIILKPSVYLITKNPYCSNECYWKDKTNRVPHGKDSPYYNRIDTICDNCGKEISIIPSHYNIENSFGDNHNFCSHKCYSEYRSKYYREEKNFIYGKQLPKEWCDKLRKSRLKNASSDDRLNSKAQIKTNELLDELNISYKREYPCEYYLIDNYLEESGLMIEVMGEYWHANPLKYNKNKYGLNKIQLKGIHRDKLKASYIMNHYGVKILYLWEQDILKNKEKCKELIKLYLNNNGEINNYHSFNYHMENGSIKLNNTIIVPYQDQIASDYNCLLNIKEKNIS